MRRISVMLLLLAFTVVSGCASTKVSRGADENEQELARLRDQLKQKDGEIDRLSSEKDKEIKELKEQLQGKLSDLEQGKKDLEEKLKKEIADFKAKLEMTERGLVITFLAEIFFDSGKDVIKVEGEQTLQKVAKVLNTSVSKSDVAVEGHTDNEPIKYSGWKSNWELSTARALSVVHYFIDSCSVTPERLSAVGYGEYSPVTSNDSEEGMQKNRRVEIVILPALVEKVKQ